MKQKMTAQQASETADKMIALIDRANLAWRNGHHAVAAELLREVHAIAETLPTREIT